MERGIEDERGISIAASAGATPLRLAAKHGVRGKKHRSPRAGCLLTPLRARVAQRERAATAASGGNGYLGGPATSAKQRCCQPRKAIIEKIGRVNNENIRHGERKRQPVCHGSLAGLGVAMLRL